MSVISSRTSILKNYAAKSRNEQRQSIGHQNRVRFDLLKFTDLREALTEALEKKNVKGIETYLDKIRDPHIKEQDLFRIIAESRQCIDLMTAPVIVLVESLLAIDWLAREPDTILEYQKFLLDLVSGQSRYTQSAVEQLVGHWVPKMEAASKWQLGVPSVEVRTALEYVHETINVLLDVIPMCQMMLLQTIERMFPYYTRPSYVVAGYVSNVLWFIDYRSAFKDDLLQLLVKKYV